MQLLHALKQHRNYAYLLCLIISLSACSSTTPDEQRVKDKISNQLIKDTMGQLFEVEAVTINSAELSPEQDYHVTATYTLKYTHSLQSYIDYMFKDTQLDNRIDSSAVKNEVRNKLVKKYGHASVGATKSFQDSFLFRKEAFGWEIQDTRDYSEVQSFLP